MSHIPALALLGVVTLTACSDANPSQVAATPTSVATTPSTGPATAPPGPTRSPLPRAGEPLALDPSDFTTEIDNPYLPLAPGNRWVYRETDTTGTVEQVVVEVLPQTKKIANGVVARVVRDTATEDGVPVEITDDWYAQDGAGNVWYLGEAVSNYEDGELVDHEGSFEAGVKGAQAGVAMPAHPVPGLAYRQEHARGEAEDRGAVVSVGQEQVEVPYGFFDKGVLMTRDLDGLEPHVQELKLYVPGVGSVLSVHLDGDGGRAELVSFRKG